MQTPAQKTTDSERPLLLQLVVIGGFVFVACMLFALAQSIYRDTFQVGGYIRSLMTDIASEKTAVVQQQRELAYAKTPQYQEKMAKELLGLQLPGEKAIILTDQIQDFDTMLPADKRLNKPDALLTNPQKWLKFLFGI